MLLVFRLDIQDSLVRLQSCLIQPWRFLCVCVWTHDDIQKRHQNRTWNTVELDIIQFVLRSWRSESCREYWLWCVGVFVCADRTNVSTRRLGSECSLPWHVWIDSRTSVKCVKDTRCIEDFCVCVSGHMTTYRNDTKTGLDTQSNLISYNLFWEVGGVSRVESTDFDVLVCVGVWTVRLTSRLDF
jgi:hypothetical protein